MLANMKDQKVAAVMAAMMEVATKPGPNQVEAARLVLEYLTGHPKSAKEGAT